MVFEGKFLSGDCDLQTIIACLLAKWIKYILIYPDDS